jgi:hypothetical protein
LFFVGDELAASAFVNGKLTVGIDLTFEDVENVGTRSDEVQLRVAVASEGAIGLKLLERMEPFLTVIIEHIFVVQDGNIEVLQSSAVGVSDGLDSTTSSCSMSSSSFWTAVAWWRAVIQSSSTLAFSSSESIDALGCEVPSQKYQFLSSPA